MRIKTVRATSFGPFSGETLEPAEGLTVVFGENEAGKSSWVAATYAALCGTRRGKGRPSREDSDFADRHRPWDGSTWEVGCEVELADGRSIELRHDLDGRVDCSARDRVLGRDVSSEVMFEGSPDAARFLGLDRRAFRAVAIVRQAEILDVTNRTEALREHLERAAATAGADETAAAAIQAISDYRRDQVGTDRAPTKPLVDSRRAVVDCSELLTKASEAHRAWLDAAVSVERFEAIADAKQASWLQAQRFQAAQDAIGAATEATQATARLTKSSEIAARVPNEPPAVPPDAAVADRVRSAVEAWRHRPTAAPLEGEDAVLIERRLAELPEVQPGDLAPAPAVEAARDLCERASSRLSLHREQRPAAIEHPDLRGVTEEDLLGCAQLLDTPVPPAVPASTMTGTADGPRNLGRVVALAIGVLSAVGAGGAIAAGQPFVAILLGVVAVGALVAALLIRPSAVAPLTSGNDAYGVARQMHEAGMARRSEAVTWAEGLGLVPDPASLRALAAASQRSTVLEQSRRSWAAREIELETLNEQAIGSLAQALRGRSASLGAGAGAEEVMEALRRYQSECDERRRIAERSGARAALTQALQQRRLSERTAASAKQEIAEAEACIREAAEGAAIAGAATSDATTLGSHLEEWLQDYERRCAALDEDHLDWRELQTLLSGASIEDLRTTAEELTVRAQHLRRALGEQPVPELDLGPDPSVTLERLRLDARAADASAAGARAAHERDGERLVSVPAIEEELAAATRRNEHVESVAAILDLTHDFLASAQERVHRDIAPLLGRKVEGRLAAVTGGRYREVTVDPERLEVQAKDAAGRWRNAALLSHGTAEQIYFLLRVAMVEILTGPPESCPMIVDDPTVHADRHRTTRLLDVIHEVSRDHQVLLFSQEEDVLAWARTHLGARDRLIELAGPDAA